MGAPIRDEGPWIEERWREPCLMIGWKILRRLLRQAFMTGSKGHNTWEEFLAHVTNENQNTYDLPIKEKEDD